MKYQNCENYNIFVNLPKNTTRKIDYMMNSHLKTNWNDKANSIIRATDFEWLFAILDSNSRDNRIVFVLERLDKIGLYDQFNEIKVVYNWKFQDYELGKILKPSDEELSEVIKGNNDNNNYHVEAILSCNICHTYKHLDDLNGYIPKWRPFKCYHYYNGDCLEQWEEFKLIQNNGIAKQINCSFCKSVVREVYDNLYAYKWKVDGLEVKVYPYTMIEVIDLEESKENEETNSPHFE